MNWGGLANLRIKYFDLPLWYQIFPICQIFSAPMLIGANTENTNCLVILNFNCHSELVSESVLDAEMNSA